MSSSVANAAEAEIWVVPFFGQGHLFPCIELCKHIASRNYKSTLIIPSHISTARHQPHPFLSSPIPSLWNYRNTLLISTSTSSSSSSSPPCCHAQPNASRPSKLAFNPGTRNPTFLCRHRRYDGLDSKTGERGLIITGWAPQLLILSHQSTGGFLSHCGWNSTVETIGCGVPILAWPIRGDQHYNAKLVTNHLKVGYVISDDQSKPIQKDDIVSGIEKVMGDQQIKERAHMLRSTFDHGFPKSSVASLNAFKDLIDQKSV